MIWFWTRLKSKPNSVEPLEKVEEMLAFLFEYLMTTKPEKKHWLTEAARY